MTSDLDTSTNTESKSRRSELRVLNVRDPTYHTH